MSATTYKLWSATTAALTAPPVAAVSSGTANTVKTIQQLKLTQSFRVIEWGYSLTQTPASNCEIELIDTGAIPATMATAYVAGDIVKYSNVANADTPPLTLGTGSSGFGLATAEGTITATRLLDFNYENGLYVKQQFPLSREAEVPAANYLRVRITPTAAGAISIVSYITIEI